MQTRTFNTIVKDQLDLCRSTLVRKAGEYATDADRLHNFRRAARILDRDEIDALLGMQSKHLTSILDILDICDNGLENAASIPDDEVLDEKFTDAINYFILLKAMLKERRAGMML